MFHSAEIRWFMEGDAPDDVRQWFTASGFAHDEAPRVDEYLVLPGATSTGVKFRQYPGDDRASFEIKTRTSDPVAVRFGDHASGQMDTWVKWSCRPTDVASFRESITAGEELWVHVEKRRCLRKFSLEGTDPVEVNPKTDRPPEGCQLELTLLRAAPAGSQNIDWASADSWWSLSFEAFGKPDSLTDYVQKVATLTLDSWTMKDLDAADSYSYPHWLLRFVR